MASSIRRSSSCVRGVSVSLVNEADSFAQAGSEVVGVVMNRLVVEVHRTSCQLARREISSDRNRGIDRVLLVYGREH